MKPAIKIILSLLYLAAVVTLLLLITHAFRHDNIARVATAPPRHSTTSKPAPKASAPAKVSPSNGSLANSGPGDIAGIFLTVAIFSAAAHWLINNHKLYLNKV